MIKVKHISKSYCYLNQSSSLDRVENTEVILENISWSIDQNKFIAIFGKSGSGKSTFLNLLSGLDKPDKGEVLFENSNIYQMSDHKLSNLRLSQFGFIFQTFNLISTLTASENIEYPLVLLKQSLKQRTEQVAQWLELVGLKDYGNKLPSQLSGGQRQRVAIARALVKNPKVVFADEPTANLDETTSQSILNLLVELKLKNDSSIIYVTHDTDIMSIAEKKYIITHKQLLEYK
jgi:putative ABC transport system ATP-binding protein